MAQEGKSTGTTKAKTAFSPPTISLPKGSGAIRGIGEKFVAKPVTGTGCMSMPLPTSQGRSGFGPQLSLRTIPVRATVRLDSGGLPFSLHHA
jgi:hypothetical protein